MKTIKEATLEELNDYSKLLDPLLGYLNKYWDIQAKPKGYNKFVENYKDFDGIGDDKYDCEFEGLLDTTASSYPFPVKLSLPYVAYDDKCQGRSPIEVLIGAALSYGLIVGAKREELNISNDNEFRYIIDILMNIKKGYYDDKIDTLKESVGVHLDFLEIKFPQISEEE